MDRATIAECPAEPRVPLVWWKRRTLARRLPDSQGVITLNIDGRGVLFSGGAVQMYNPNPNLAQDGFPVIFELTIAGNVAAFLAFMRAFVRGRRSSRSR
jgi:hypothetical protein